MIKISLVGSRQVGKSSLLTMLNTGNLDDIKVYEKFYYKVEDEPINIFKLVDTNKADIIIVMFDTTNIFSLNFVENFLNYNKTKPIIILGNKCDLANYDCNKQNIHYKMEEYIKIYSNIIGFHYISVKTFSGIITLLDKILLFLQKK